MKLTKFYRIHHKTDVKIGCYNNDANISIRTILYCPEYSSDWESHPLPYQDTKLSKSVWSHLDGNFDAYHFGFSSIDQLKAWFYNDYWLEWLHNEGYVLSEFDCYDVPDYYIAGNAQAIAKLDKAHHVASYLLYKL